MRVLINMQVQPSHPLAFHVCLLFLQFPPPFHISVSVMHLCVHTNNESVLLFTVRIFWLPVCSFSLFFPLQDADKAKRTILSLVLSNTENKFRDKKYSPTVTSKPCLLLKMGGLLAHHSLNIASINSRSNEHIKQEKQDCYLCTVTG